MALKLTIPDTIRPFLKSTDAKGVYGVKDTAAWLNRRFAKIAPLSITVVDGEDKKRFGSKILGIHQAKNEFTLILDNFVPMPPAEFYSSPKKIQVRLMYVEWGYEVVSVFSAVALRRVNVKGNPAVQVGSIEDVKVMISTHVTSLGKTSGVELGLFVRGGFVEARVDRMSLNRIWFTGQLPDDVRDEGITIDKASLKLGDEEGDTFTVKLQAFPEKSGGYEGRLLELPHVSKVANFIERRWTQQARRLAEESGRSDPKAGPSSIVPQEERKLDDYLRPHYFLLGEDEAWVEGLGKHGVCVPVPEKDTEKVLAKLDESRCDMIIGDADFWDTDALEIAQLIRSHEKYSQVPMIWIAGPDNIFAENGGQDLIDLGAYDFIDRNTSEEEIKRCFFWANPKNHMIGEGPALCLVSQSNRAQYRYGKALRTEGIQTIKISGPESGITSRLLENDARWILIDGPELEEDIEKTMKSVLEWATRGDSKREVFLVEQGMTPDEVAIWKAAGAAEVITYDPSLEAVKTLIKPRLAPKAPPAPPEEPAEPEAPAPE